MDDENVLRRLAAALVAGVLFGVGLCISGMTQPAKVVSFLDVAGAWDASLALVMGGAIATHVVAVRVARKRATPIYAGTFHWPVKSTIDKPLVVGSAIFGVGWGLGGFCPGPALVSAASGSTMALVFAGAMTAGMILRHATQSRS